MAIANPFTLPGRYRPCLARISALVLLSAACSDDAAVVDSTESSALPAPGAGPSDAPEPAAGSVYAMTVHAFGPDITTSYLVTMPSVDEGSFMDLDAAIELPAFANVGGIVGEPFVWLGYGGEPTIARWDLQPDGRLVPGPTLSFANLGASEVSPDAQGAFISMDLAAVPNQETGELLFWNPTTMEIVGTLNLEIPVRDGIPPLIRSTTARADGTLLLSYYYISPEGEFADGAGIVVVDPSGPSVVARDEWAGCNYNYARATDDGTVYLTVGAQWIQRRLIYATHAHPRRARQHLPEVGGLATGLLGVDYLDRLGRLAQHVRSRDHRCIKEGAPAAAQFEDGLDVLGGGVAGSPGGRPAVHDLPG